MHHVHAALSLPQCEDVRLIISEAGAAAAPAVVVPLAGIADRNRIHASGFEIDVKSAICEFAFAEHLPQQLKNGGRHPLVEEQVLPVDRA